MKGTFVELKLVFVGFAASVALGGMLVIGSPKSAESATDPSATTAPVSSAGDATKGAALYAARCASCHGAAGAGAGMGPPLKDEKSRKDTAAAIAWIKSPQPPMPKLYPSPLSEKDVADVTAYVESL
jgi:mono/diheme cytochrome c family protein